MNKGNHKRHLELAINPRLISTAQQKGEKVLHTRGGGHFILHYTKKKVVDSHNMLLAEIVRLSEGLPRMEDCEGQCWWLTVEFVYPTSDKKLYGQYKTTAPDGDNLVKLLQDVITESGFYWHNDGQVQVEGIVRRWITRGEQPRILLTIRNRPNAFNRDPIQYFRKETNNE
jgi:hypothetical protein